MHRPLFYVTGLILFIVLYTSAVVIDPLKTSPSIAPVAVEQPVQATESAPDEAESMIDIMEQVCAMGTPKDKSSPKNLVLNRKSALWWLNWYRESKNVKGVINDAALNREAERIADQIRQCPRAALDSPFSGKVIVRVGDKSLEGFVRAAIGDPRSEAIILRQDVRRVGAALLVDKDSHWVTHWVVVFK